VRYPQWYLLLVTVLGILSDCRSSRDLEAFAKRHRETLNQALGLNFKRWPTDATFLYLFNKAHLEQFGEVLQAWMISQIPDGTTALDQLVCDGKTLKGSAIETADGNCQATSKTGPEATRKLGHPGQGLLKVCPSRHPAQSLTGFSWRHPAPDPCQRHPSRALLQPLT
jgi:hypothetical protein